MTQDLSKLSLCDARAGLVSKQFSAVELTQACINRAKATQDLNVFITPTFDQALEYAKQSDTRLQQGNAGIMEGLPIGIKDLFCTKGVRTTAASHILDNFIPPYESTITQKLRDAGSVFMGKLNLDQFAMGSANLTSAYGVVKTNLRANNDDKVYVPGGSSGGSSASVLAGSSLAATGTDTGGSIRQPAAFCGLVGLKPTYGLCSRFGVIAFASSLDQAGPITRSVKDAALMLNVMAGYDAKDSTSLNVQIPQYLNHVDHPIKGMRIGIPAQYQVEGLNPDIEQLWQQGINWLKDAGAEIVNISLPHTKYALPAYYIIAPAEASSNLARYDGVRYGKRTKAAPDIHSLYNNTRAENFGSEVKRRILMGTYVLSAGYYDAYYIKAHKVKRLIAQDFDQAFEQVDLILTPTTPTPAFAFGEEPQDPVSMYMNDILTVPANLAGLPAISVPAGRASNGLPLGLQLIAPPLQEQRMIQAAYRLEQAAQFQHQLPY